MDSLEIAQACTRVLRPFWVHLIGISASDKNDPEVTTDSSAKTDWQEAYELWSLLAAEVERRPALTRSAASLATHPEDQSLAVSFITALTDCFEEKPSLK